MNNYYALITGASRGFGKAMALDFASRGMNLVLVALPNSGLKELSSFIKKNYHVDVFFVEADLSLVESYYKIADYIKNNNIQIKYLINNAGVLSRGFFEDMEDNFVLKQIEVNVSAPTLLIKLLLPNLKSNTPAGILNVSSMASFFALPKKQVYGATKAFLLSFSKSLRKELKKDNISVTTVCPGGLNTTTRLCYQNRICSWITRESVLSPEEAANISINGMLEGKKLIIPGFVNKCFMILDKILPEFLKDKLTNMELNKFKAVT
ncbi:MAG: SDR family NAD(P)-dependent oxidoreductase [Bacteroidetes bacterium]|nr:SDR family NAD(P)-dependent oxidoreductase [Bacteroidota bacterium]